MKHTVSFNWFGRRCVNSFVLRSNKAGLV